MRRRRRGLVDPAAHSSDAFRTLRLALQLRSGAQTGNVVVVTSAEPGAGKTTVASNFALVSSLLPGRTLLVDGDLRNPTLHDIFSVPRSPGLVDLLAAGSGLDHFVHHAGAVGQLDVLTAGRQVPRASDLAASPNMADVLQEASEAYDLVVVDAPPLMSVSDAEGLATHPRVVVVVVTRPKTKARQLTNAMRKLELIEANVAGLVVNGAPGPAAYGY
jgi:capsular exopolysaccharide synthesis family protein